jgi:hypothetical protein
MYMALGKLNMTHILPGYTDEEDGFIESAVRHSSADCDSIGLDTVVNGMLGWTLKRAWIPKKFDAQYETLVAVWP